MTEIQLEDRLYTVREVAQIFSVTEFTVRSWINQGNSDGKRLAAMKVGKSWRVSRAAMATWANATVGSTQ